MDLSLLHIDDQTLSPPAVTESQTRDLDNLTLHMKSAYESGIEIVSDLSDPTDKSTDPLSNVSKCLFQEKSTNSDCVKPLSYSYKMSDCFSLCSEPVPKDDDLRVHGYLSSSDPVPLLPHFSNDLIPASPEIYTEHESTLSFPVIEENTTPQPFGAMSSTLGSLREQPVNETLPSSSSEYSQAMHLLRSLSHQSDSLESDTGIAPMSELYIFESETKDFILSPSVDSQEIKCSEYPSLLQTEGKEADRDCDTHVMMCDSAEVVTQCHQGSTDVWTMANYESDVSQRTGLRPPAVDARVAGLMSVNDARQGKAEVSGFTTQTRQTNSPIELWLDACQYLAGEDKEDRDVLDKTDHSVMQEELSAISELSFPSGETQVSGYNPDGRLDRIGWSSDDTKGWGPPAEMWSSVDSWASALSDWPGIFMAPPEDITAVFTEIGAEIDALTQVLSEVNTHTDTGTSTEEQSQELQTQPQMGVQDQPPESFVLCGQSCLSLCVNAAGLERQNRERTHSVGSFCDSTLSTQENKEPAKIHKSKAENSSCHGHKQSSMASSVATLASPGGHGIDVTADALIPPSISSSSVLDHSHFGGYTDSLESDIFISNDEVPIVLKITEDSDLEGQIAPGELMTEQPFRDGVCEVTEENRISQPLLVAKKEATRSCGPAKVDGEETQDSTDPHFLTTHTWTNSHVPGVATQPDLHIIVSTHVSSDTTADLDRARQVEPPWGSPKFIMPLAPLSISSSLICQTSLDRDQTCAKGSLNNNGGISCDQVQPCHLWTTCDGITDKPSLESDKELIHKKKNTTDSAEKSSPEGLVFYTGDTAECFQIERKTIIEDINDISGELSNLAVVSADHCMISEKERVAFITLDLNDASVPSTAKPTATAIKSHRAELSHTAEKMPHKTHKTPSEGRTRSKKDKPTSHYHGAQASKKQENLPHHVPTPQTCKQKETHHLPGENHTSQNTTVGPKDKEDKLVIETSMAAEKATNKPHGKKKKKQGQTATGIKGVGEPLVEVENGAKPKTAKGWIDTFESKLGAKPGKPQKDSDHSDSTEKKQPGAKPSQAEEAPHHTEHKNHQPKNFTSPLADDVIKRRRLSENKFGKIVNVLESKLPKPDVSIQAKGQVPKLDLAAPRKKAYSEVVKQKLVPPKEDPKVVQPIQAMSVSGSPQSLCLWCQFAAVFTNYTVTWSRDSTVLSEIKRSAGDESRVSLTISYASHKDLGKYHCRLSSLHGSVTLDYLLTYEVLSEIVIPPSPKTTPSEPVDVGNEEEDVQFSKLIFRDDFLSDQFFGENHLISIITEKAHFGEGMHRRAFRTKLQGGQVPLLLPGHSCVLKVHNAISYGTKNNDELIQKNFNLAVEVQTQHLP
ncbi:alpha-protein kinase 2 [Scomber scombrus]|uniref:non-specific serine/threonine protein kinase n=1 Tax=Scomber scombrus TaxID=13677 RepID=A0AAV1N8T2_SCOSC